MLTDNSITLNNGFKMPVPGFGMYMPQDGHKARQAAETALQYGYRHIDTASMYRNETETGQAIASSLVPRSDIFVTTKVWNSDQGYDRTLKAFDISLKKLGLDYLDLYLIHWPEPGLRNDTWRALERLLQQGRVRSIGVSNYMIKHLKELLSLSPIVPAVNQVEYHPWLQHNALKQFSDERGIITQAYCPLVRGKRFSDPELIEIAKRKGRTPAQILIRWSLQMGLVPLPKSASADRIKENINIFDFELSPEEMNILSAKNSGLHCSWAPETID